MAVMKRIVTAASAALALALALPAVAPATLTEVGVLPATTPPTVPSCPGSPCLAVSRTTGFQVKVGASYGPLAAPRKGSVVAWTIMLGKPNATQLKFFNANEGGEAEAGIAVLRPVRKPNLSYRLVAVSPTVKLKLTGLSFSRRLVCAPGSMTFSLYRRPVFNGRAATKRFTRRSS